MTSGRGNRIHLLRLPFEGPTGPVLVGLRRAAPAVVVAVAYVDPGNFATNVAAGSEFGSELLSVVLMASAAGMLLQCLAAKLGTVTRRSLPELCRERYPPLAHRALWVQAEAVTMATDVAEIVGSAVALNLLFGVPLPTGGLISVAVGLLILAMRGPTNYRFEMIIAGLLAVVLLAFIYQILRVGAFAEISLVAPVASNPAVVLVAASVVGATIMPHAIYVHSGLAAREAKRVIHTNRERADSRLQLRIVGALAAAALVNVAILLVAAQALHGRRIGGGSDELTDAYLGLATVSGGLASAFALALLAAGIASTAVGTLAGDMVMRGFLQRRIPIPVRRIVTTGPAMLVLAISTSTTEALVVSQVVLSFGVPFATIPLIHLTATSAIMGDRVNHWGTTAAAIAVTVVVCTLNAMVIGTMTF